MMVQATVEPDQYYVCRSLKASIYSDATFESDVVTELDRGHELEVLSTEGVGRMFSIVKTNRVGFINITIKKYTVAC